MKRRGRSSPGVATAGSVATRCADGSRESAEGMLDLVAKVGDDTGGERSGRRRRQHVCVAMVAISPHSRKADDRVSKISIMWCSVYVVVQYNYIHPAVSVRAIYVYTDFTKYCNQRLAATQRFNMQSYNIKGFIQS